MKTLISIAIGSISEASEISAAIVCRDELEPPSFEYEQSLRDVQIVRAGDSAKFILRVYGKPAPRVKWLKDGNDLDLSHRVKVENTPTHTFLTISNTTRQDSGNASGRSFVLQYDLFIALLSLFVTKKNIFQL